MNSYFNNDTFYFVCEKFDKQNNIEHYILFKSFTKDYPFAKAFEIANYEAEQYFGKQEIKIITYKNVWYNWKVRPITEKEYLQLLVKK